MYFSFKDGDPIAIVENFKHKKSKKKIIYISDKEDPEVNEIIDFIDDNLFNGYVPYQSIHNIRRAIKEGHVPYEPKLRKLYEIALLKASEISKKSLKIENGTIQPIPSIDEREIIYICGPSGSGKSVFASNYIKQYNKLFHKNPIYVFSRVENDPAFDKLKNLNYIPLTEDILDKEIHSNQFTDSLVLFDDIDTEPNPKIKEYLDKLKAELLETGRHTNTYLVITSHLISNYRETRKVLNEFHAIVLFPSSGGRSQMDYILSRQFGLTKKNITRLFDLVKGSRWIFIYKHYPQYVIYNHGVFFLNSLS